MKKLIFLILLSILTINVFSQSTSYAYKLEMGTWNIYSEKWNWQDPIDIDLTFTLSKTYVSINDKAKTYLKIIEADKNQNDDDLMSNSWICNDESGRRCVFTMMGFKKKSLIVYSIMYNDTCFRYYIKNGSKIDNFQNN